MISNLLETENVDVPLQELILDKTEGIPFFIEEFIKSFKELKIIEQKHNSYKLTKSANDVSIPSTIHDVIMARVDSLPSKSKELIQRLVQYI